MLFAICMSYYEKYLLRSFAHSLNWIVVFVVLSCVSSLQIVDINHLSDVSLANIFSHSVGCLFILLMFSFAMQTLFNLM